MTNPQTVPVPISALKRLKDERELRFFDAQGALYNVRADTMADLIALIPTPPKVGDEIEYENRHDLPYGTVVADKDGDLWVHLETGYAYINIQSREQVEEEPGVERAPSSYYGPFTIVYLRD